MEGSADSWHQHHIQLMKSKLQQWYGLYELLDSPSLRKALSNDGIDELAKWRKKVPTDEAGPLLR